MFVEDGASESQGLRAAICFRSVAGGLYRDNTEDGSHSKTGRSSCAKYRKVYHILDKSVLRCSILSFLLVFATHKELCTVI